MTDLLTPFWSAWVTILSLACWGSVTALLWWILRVKPHIEEDGTTGHEYDGIKEYDKPMPRWWLVIFWSSIVFAVFYMAMYPSLGNWKGLATVGGEGSTLPWTSVNEMLNDVNSNNAVFAKGYKERFGDKDVLALSQDPRALKMGGVLFLQNCSVCHGSNAKGAKGFPNLTDSDWLYGGEPATISTTIHKGRQAGMPTWQEKLGEDGVQAAAEYVLSLNGKTTPLDVNLVAKGKAIFAENCAVCHGADAKGLNTTGAPNLTDTTWLYGGDRETIRTTIRYGRNGMMPTWEAKLGDERIKLLSAYVYSLSHQ